MRAPFSSLPEILSAPSFGPLSGALFDLGVSSPQLDRVERGFSFRVDGPLDMRMDPTTGLTAADLLNSLPEESLAALFRENGEGRLSGRIARAIVRSRPLTSTRQLAEVVSSAVPAAVRRKGHPARRVFQALRIEVNDELGQLRAALPVALSHLAVGGVCAVISYHSGEDRLTKQTFADAASGGCVCPPGLPCVCGAVARHTLVFRGARKPSPSEVAANPRAESARLRAIVRTEADQAEKGGEEDKNEGKERGQGQGPALMAPPSAATAAPARRVGRRAAAPTPRRAPLRLIPGRSGSGTRQRRAPGSHSRLLNIVAISLVVAALLAVVVSQALLANGQVRLSSLQHELALEQSAHRQSELAVAQLETPSRIVAAASGQLHMVRPANIVELPYVSLSVPLPTPKVTAAPAVPATTTTVPAATTTPATGTGAATSTGATGTSAGAGAPSTPSASGASTATSTP